MKSQFGKMMGDLEDNPSKLLEDAKEVRFEINSNQFLHIVLHIVLTVRFQFEKAPFFGK